MDKWNKMELKPGDILLYSGKGFFSTLVKLKTGSRYSHTEVYIGNGVVWGSRDGIGVKEFPFKQEGLKAIIRPKCLLNWEAGNTWFHTIARGQKYDWIGLLNFYIAKWQGRENGKMFCSEFVVRLFRILECPLFPEWVDADAIAPGDLPQTMMGTFFKE